jgi:hypothetical protein
VISDRDFTIVTIASTASTKNDDGTEEPAAE